MIPSKTVVATSGGISATGVVTTVATIFQALNGHPTNPGTLGTGVLFTLSGLVGLIAHYHKGVSLMANQNDLDSLISRLGSAFRKVAGSSTAQTVELDISEGLKLADEMEAFVQKFTQSQAGNSGTSAVASNTTSADSSTASTVADTGSDFSKLTAS